MDDIRESVAELAYYREHFIAVNRDRACARPGTLSALFKPLLLHLLEVRCRHDRGGHR